MSWKRPIDLAATNEPRMAPNTVVTPKPGIMPAVKRCSHSMESAVGRTNVSEIGGAGRSAMSSNASPVSAQPATTQRPMPIPDRIWMRDERKLSSLKQ